MAIILTGMHRSGTSMFARFMHESGICMGETFYIDKTANRYGHYEDMDFLNLQRHELIRHFKGEDWLVFHNFTHTDDFATKAAKLYRGKVSKNNCSEWGWKDPRTTLFMDFWMEVDPSIRTIFMVRQPKEVLNSLCRLLKTRWSQKEKSKYLKTYTHYNRSILNFAHRHQNQNMAIISMNQLAEDPVGVLARVNMKINTGFDPQLFKTLFDSSAISSDAFIPSIFIGRQLNEAQSVFDNLRPFFV